MPGLSKRLCCVMLLMLQLACSTQVPPEAVRREYYDPAYLNEAAIAALAAGERGTAVILLERAAVLAPQDVLIRDNLAAMREGGVVRVMPGVPVEVGARAPASASAQSPKTAPTAVNVDEPTLPGMGIWPLK